MEKRLQDGFDYLAADPRIIAVRKLGKHLYAFTPDKTYILRRLRWYHRVLAWFRLMSFEETYVAEEGGVWGFLREPVNRNPEN